MRHIQAFLSIPLALAAIGLPSTLSASVAGQSIPGVTLPAPFLTGSTVFAFPGEFDPAARQYSAAPLLGFALRIGAPQAVPLTKVQVLDTSRQNAVVFDLLTVSQPEIQRILASTRAPLRALLTNVGLAYPAQAKLPFPTIMVLRLFKGAANIQGHLFATDPATIDAARRNGYVLEGPAFRLLPDNVNWQAQMGIYATQTITNGNVRNATELGQQAFLSSIPFEQGWNQQLFGFVATQPVTDSIRRSFQTELLQLERPGVSSAFLTTNRGEADNAVKGGYRLVRRVGFVLANPSQPFAVPVHRLYQPSTGRHTYTVNPAEVKQFIATGYRYEGVAFAVSTVDNLPGNGKPLFRLSTPDLPRAKG